MNIYPTITLWQPWATWIMRGWKTIETRTHDRFKSLLNKTILIHAGQRTDDSTEATRNPYLTYEQIIEHPDEVINGYVLGSAFVHDVSWLNEYYSSEALINCECTEHRYGLFLKDIIELEDPIPVKGEMGIWYFDMNTKQKVKKEKSWH